MRFEVTPLIHFSRTPFTTFLPQSPYLRVQEIYHEKKITGEESSILQDVSYAHYSFTIIHVYRYNAEYVDTKSCVYICNIYVYKQQLIIL